MTTTKSPDDTVQINAIMSRRQRDHLNEKAKSANLNLSHFLQKLIMRSTIIAKPDLSADIKKMNGSLGRINSNINMIARWCNTYKENTHSDLVLYRLSLIQKDISDIADFTVDVRAQGFGKRRKAKAPKSEQVAS